VDAREHARPAAVPPRVIAVDWSGAAGAGAARKIWVAEVAQAQVVRLVGGRSREAVTADLAECVRASAEVGAPLVIGLDFAFSLPAWFLDAAGAPDGPGLWALAARDADAWLACTTPPFWGRNGTRRPAADDARPALRATEQEVAAATGFRPSSAFKLVGPDQVGAASVRGMPTLAALRGAGAAVWPFDDPVRGRPSVVEVWPRAAYAERVTKSSAEGRAAYLARHAPGLAPSVRAAAEAGDDAFDALATALALWHDRATLAALPPARSAEERREGRIWWPGLPPAGGG
jgi:hypothetical protein